MSNLATAANASPYGSLVTYIPLILMFLVLYFLLIRPQQKRTKTRNMMLANLKKNDKIVTIGGLHGTILEITDDIVVLRVNDATKMTFDRSAVNTVVTSSTVAEEKK
ncbi:preprotein translocase subunit YajC [Paenibacillus sp. UNC499MF]|uniref:preprotein translocase subunit YajC n=1 Tax=unclassified Paenibacillus TaxID=185978 RepID=UPI00089F8DFC|nr:preprotein translocase subunit YajC [Paenibacillus sp. UNC499MF]SEF42164.1 preprotein translocase subunit YajC [Paenibacillus sp. UNC499MF]